MAKKRRVTKMQRDEIRRKIAKGKKRIMKKSIVVYTNKAKEGDNIINRDR